MSTKNRSLKLDVPQMRTALIQMECLWGDATTNLASMAKWAERAHAEGAELVVFPELTVHGIYKDERIHEVSESLDGPSVRQAREIARRTRLHVGFGISEKATPLPFNTYCVVSQEGRILGVHRKNAIPRLEQLYWQGHHERRVFDLAGLRVGVAICWDATQDDLLACYGAEHADLVLMPHAWDADPLDRAGGVLQHDTIFELFEDARSGRLGGWASHDAMREQFYAYIPQRARQHNFAAVFVNQSGQPHPALRFEGPSFAVNREGRVVVETKDGSDQMLIADIP